MQVVDVLSMASNQRPFLGVGKYSEPVSSIDEPDSASTSPVVGELSACTACDHIRHHGSDAYLGMSPVQNDGSYLMY